MVVSSIKSRLVSEYDEVDAGVFDNYNSIDDWSGQSRRLGIVEARGED
jgi:hypothetical protein